MPVSGDDGNISEYTNSNFHAIQQNENTFILDKIGDMHVQVPLATGSGRIIRILIQRSVAPGATYIINGQSGSTNFGGTLLMHNKSAEIFNTILKIQSAQVTSLH